MSPRWWNANTVSSGQSERDSIPPSPTWLTMSRSCQSSAAATARNAARSICFPPLNVVCLVEGVTGLQSRGSEQFQTTPCAHVRICSCPMVRVGTAGGVRPSLRALAALSASCSHGVTIPSYTPSRYSSPIAMLPARMRSARFAACSSASGCDGRECGLGFPFGLLGACAGQCMPTGNASCRKLSSDAGLRLRIDAKRGGRCLASSHARATPGPSRGPSATRPPPSATAAPLLSRCCPSSSLRSRALAVNTDAKKAFIASG